MCSSLPIPTVGNLTVGMWNLMLWMYVCFIVYTAMRMEVNSSYWITSPARNSRLNVPIQLSVERLVETTPSKSWLVNTFVYMLQRNEVYHIIIVWVYMCVGVEGASVVLWCTLYCVVSSVS